LHLDIVVFNFQGGWHANLENVINENNYILKLVDIYLLPRMTRINEKNSLSCKMKRDRKLQFHILEDLRKIRLKKQTQNVHLTSKFLCST